MRGYLGPMSIDTSATLGTLVTEDSRRGRVLERFGLDYCCNGHRTLREASTEAGLDLAAVAAALDIPDRAATTSTGPTTNSALAHDIVDTHHAYLWAEMPRLQALVDKVHRVHGERHPELAQVHDVYDRLVADLDPHMTREERSVFPAISRLERGQGDADLAEAIAQLAEEHQVVGDLLKELNAVTAGYAVPDDACGSYRAMLDGLKEMEFDLHEHIHKENNILFPQVLELTRTPA